MNTTDYSKAYYFTKPQAEKVARDLIVTAHETSGLTDEDVEKLAYRISGILEIPAKISDLYDALQALDHLVAVDSGVHAEQRVYRDGTVDNTADLVERYESHLTDSIREITARFRDHMELAA